MDSNNALKLPAPNPCVEIFQIHFEFPHFRLPDDCGVELFQGTGLDDPGTVSRIFAANSRAHQNPPEFSASATNFMRESYLIDPCL
jgi:hypothetical protein